MDSSRIASFSQGFALLLLAASAGCSSSSSSPDAGASSGSGSSSGSSGSGSSSGSGMNVGDGGTIAEHGMACTAETSRSVAVQINLNVTWPATGSINGGKGPYVLWLLSEQTIDREQDRFDDPHLSADDAADFAERHGRRRERPHGRIAMGKVGTESPVTEWEKVTRTTMTTGTLGGWNIGSSIVIDDAVTLNGLDPNSMFKDPTTKWPKFSAAGIPFGDGFMYTDDEGDMNPGIAVIPISTAGYAKIRTGLGGMKPAVDKIFIASRTELSMHGISTSCTEAEGIADVKLIDNHVIGCEIENGGGPCDANGAGYIDSNRTVYVPGTATFKQHTLRPVPSAPTPSRNRGSHVIGAYRPHSSP